LPESQRDGWSGGNLEESLSQIVALGKAAWPQVTLDPESFVAYVAERLPAETSDLSRVRAADLFVACACANGDGAAVAALDERAFGTLRDSLRRMRLAPEQIDDVLQGLRRILFAGDEIAAPRIREYSGQGDLIGWLRVSATRSALKLIRREKREVPGVDALEERATDGDPELHYMKALYRDAFRTAFQRAIDSLTDREKNLLRQHVVDELSIDDLGGLYQVHRATAARWLAAARETLLERTRTFFMESARVSGAECESVLRLVQSQLDATIRRRLDAARA
jgi:RNA polymerase sigma-70 factor (ECF subfamily)